MSGKDSSFKGLKCAVIVAHPDDEILWCGGLVLMNPENSWEVIACCRGSDPDRNPKFFKALKVLGAHGKMGDVDDSPEQDPLNSEEVENLICALLTNKSYDLIVTHGMSGEYTYHRRHVEVAHAVTNIMKNKRIYADKLWQFAYEDGNKKYFPRAITVGDCVIDLPDDIWNKKYNIITSIYGFDTDSWEAKTTPKTESFWCLTHADLITKV